MKQYSVDFGSWMVEASSPEEARTIAENKIANGDVPPIDTVIEEPSTHAASATCPCGEDHDTCLDCA